MSMRQINVVVAFVLMLCVCTMGHASPFVNLDFEQSTVLPSDGSVVSTAAAFPGWTARFGNSTSSNVYHDYEGIGEPIVAVYDKGVSAANYVLLQGHYMGFLAPGTSNSITSLSQVGDVPLSAQFITLLADGAEGPPIVNANGVIVPMAFLSGSHLNGHAARYFGDIRTFAGTAVEFRFECTNFFNHASGRQSFDDVQFVPEPACALYLIMSGTLLKRSLVCSADCWNRRHRMGGKCDSFASRSTTNRIA